MKRSAAVFVARTTFLLVLVHAATGQQLGAILGGTKPGAVPTTLSSQDVEPDTNALTSALGAISGNKDARDVEPDTNAFDPAELGAISGGSSLYSGGPSQNGPISTILGQVSGPSYASSGNPPSPSFFGATPARGAADSDFLWEQSYAMGFTSTIRDTSKILQGFGPGLVPLRNNDPRMMVLKKRFNTEVGIAYPVLITAGNLKNGTRAGTLNIGIRDLVRKMSKMPMNALGQLIHTGALPLDVDMDVIMQHELSSLPEMVSYQIVCGDEEQANVLEFDPEGETCVPKASKIRPQLLPEFTFFTRLICTGWSPREAWEYQCASFSSGPMAVGEDCMWKPPQNVTMGDKDKDMARIVESQVRVSELLNPAAAGTVTGGDVPIQMAAKVSMIEELLHTNKEGEAKGVNTITPAMQFPLDSPVTQPSKPVGSGPSLGAISGRKLLQQLGAISGGGVRTTMPASPGTPAGSKVGIVLERVLETGLIPHVPEQLTRAKGMEAVSMCPELTSQASLNFPSSSGVPSLETALGAISNQGPLPTAPTSSPGMSSNSSKVGSLETALGAISNRGAPSTAPASSPGMSSNFPSSSGAPTLGAISG